MSLYPPLIALGKPASGPIMLQASAIPLGGELGLRSRFFYDDPRARLDRQVMTGLEWFWFAEPYISRVFRLDLENSRSSLSDKSYSRIIFTMAGEFRY